MKIKVPQFDHVGEYKDRYLRFGRKNDIGIHFTVGTHGVAKEMNHFLLEKARYLLSNAQLDKIFWAKAMVYACHLMNKLSSTVIDGKTLLDIWSGGDAQDYDLL